MEAPHEIWLWLIGQVVLEKKIFENGGRMDDRRMDDGPWLYYKLTNEPKGSDELTRGSLVLYRSHECWGYVKFSGNWGKEVRT